MDRATTTSATDRQALKCTVRPARPPYHGMNRAFCPHHPCDRVCVAYFGWPRFRSVVFAVSKRKRHLQRSSLQLNGLASATQTAPTIAAQLPCHRSKPPSQVQNIYGMVPGTGVEPVRCYHRGILSPLRLPISPPGHRCGVRNSTGIDAILKKEKMIMEAGPGIEPRYTALQAAA